jgi:flagellar basal body P-ring formation protein FlgA
MPCYTNKTYFFLFYTKVSIILFLILLTKITFVQAETITQKKPIFHHPQDIQHSIATFLQQQNLSKDIKTTVTPIDSRLKLKQCTKTLAINFKSNHRKAGRHSIKVACLGKVHWKIYATVLFEITRPVAIASMPILAGESLTQDNVHFEKRSIKANQNYFSHIDQLKNKIIKRPLTTGDVISPRLLKTQYLIKKGDSVTIIVETDSISVRMEGTALASGNRGDTIRLKNKKSGRSVEGVIISEKIVKIY